jgi:hypothetical protein
VARDPHPGQTLSLSSLSLSLSLSLTLTLSHSQRHRGEAGGQPGVARDPHPGQARAAGPQAGPPRSPLSAPIALNPKASPRPSRSAFERVRVRVTVRVAVRVRVRSEFERLKQIRPKPPPIGPGRLTAGPCSTSPRDVLPCRWGGVSRRCFRASRAVGRHCCGVWRRCFRASLLRCFASLFKGGTVAVFRVAVLGRHGHSGLAGTSH